MISSFSFKSALFATLTLGALFGCGGSGSGESNGEVPYILPAGTTITATFGPPTHGTIERGTNPIRPMTPEELAEINWKTRTFTLIVRSDGVANWEIFGQQTGSQYAYTRTSATSFNISVSWFGGGMNLTKCELAKTSDVYGTIGSWTSTQTDTVLVEFLPVTTVSTITGGGTPQDVLQYTQAAN